MVSITSKAVKRQFPTAQKKCIQYFLELPPYTHISATIFIKINWLPFRLTFEICTATRVFKYWNQFAPSCFINVLTTFNRYNARSQIVIDIRPQKFSFNQKGILFLGSKILSKFNTNWNTVATTAPITCVVKMEILDSLRI